MTTRAHFLPRIRHFRRRAAALSTAALGAALLGGIGIVPTPTPTAGAATSGWYVATVPGTGLDDVLLGSTCANALQCWAVGISLGNLGGPGPSSASPLMEALERYDVDARPDAVAGRGGRWTLRRHLRQRLRLLGRRCRGRVRHRKSNGHPHRTVERHIVVRRTEPHPEWSGRGGRHPLECELRVGIELHGSRLCDGRRTGTISPTSSSSGTGPAGRIVPAATTGQAFDQLISVQCLSAVNCWAVGNAGPAAQMSSFLPIFPGAVGDQGLIEHWDGSAWSIVPSVSEPAPNGGYLSGLECVGATDCWASGATTDRRAGTPRGSSWSTGTVPRGPMRRRRCPAPRRRACWPGSPA